MNHSISLAEASTMTSDYRAKKESILGPSYQDQNILPICETFDKEAFESLLATPECAQIRIYYGMDENLKIHAIIVAADGDGSDILPSSSSLIHETEEDEFILERGNRCPDLCPPASPLNS